MSINVRTVAMVLLNTTSTAETALRPLCSDQFGVRDDDWPSRQARRKDARPRCGFGVDEWFEAVDRAACAAQRIFVVMLVFSGPRRAGDVEEWLREFCAGLGLTVLILSADICLNPECDFT